MKVLHTLLIIAVIAVIGCGQSHNKHREYQGDPIAPDATQYTQADADAFLMEILGDTDLNKIGKAYTRSAQVGGAWTGMTESEFVEQVSYALASMALPYLPQYWCYVATLFEASIYANYTSQEIIGLSVFVDLWEEFPQPIEGGVPC